MKNPNFVPAISLWQPWASLWLTDAKLHETRDWPNKNFGTLIVHAAKRVIPLYQVAQDPELNAICVRHFGVNWRDTLPYGKLVGAVDLIDCIPTSRLRRTTVPFGCAEEKTGNFEPDRFGWLRGPDPKVFKTLVAWKGRQGLFAIPRSTYEGLCHE